MSVVFKAVLIAGVLSEEAFDYKEIEVDKEHRDVYGNTYYTKEKKKKVFFGNKEVSNDNDPEEWDKELEVFREDFHRKNPKYIGIQIAENDWEDVSEIHRGMIDDKYNLAQNVFNKYGLEPKLYLLMFDC